MKRTLSGAFLAFALASCLLGCGTVVSVLPLYTGDELVHPVLEPRIAGEWIVADVYGFENSDSSQPLGHSEATIASSRAEGLYTVEFRRPVKDRKRDQESYSYDARFVSLGGRLYFDAEFSELQKENCLQTGRHARSGLNPRLISSGGFPLRKTFCRLRV